MAGQLYGDMILIEPGPGDLEDGEEVSSGPCCVRIQYER